MSLVVQHSARPSARLPRTQWPAPPVVHARAARRREPQQILPAPGSSWVAAPTIRELEVTAVTVAELTDRRRAAAGR